MKTIAILLICTSVVLQAQPAGRNISKVGTIAASFLEIPVGARAIGMGSAFAGTADDATGLYWNPAGIARLPNREAIFNHIDWIADMNYDYAGVVLPLEGFGTIGLSFNALTMPEMEVRTVERPEGTGERFSSGSYAMGIHYARALSDKFSIGFTAKYITENIWDMTSQGFAIDGGVLFTTQFLNGMRIGAAITNFGTDMQLSGRDTRTFHPIDQTKLGSNDRIPENIELDSWPLPLNFQFGIAVDVMKSESHLFTVAADALHPADNYESVNLGFEYGFRQTFFVRAGYQNLFLVDGEGGLCAGAGIMGPLFGESVRGRIDYAYSDMGRLKAVNVLSVSVLF
ncbi:MAG TPA: PorV/PorQ family protein [Bacteroidota bacterium]|nr:PorV/PorQ family protein [Bacteroidota bacterium]